MTSNSPVKNSSRPGQRH